MAQPKSATPEPAKQKAVAADEPKPPFKRTGAGFFITHDPSKSGIGFGHAQ